MRSRVTKRASSGRVLSPHSKKDFRSGIPTTHGVPLGRDSKISFREGSYRTQRILRVLRDSNGKTYQSLRNITRKSVVLVESNREVLVTSTMDKRLVGCLIGMENH